MNIFAGSIEIQMLCWSVVLGLVQLVLATSLATKDQERELLTFSGGDAPQSETCEPLAPHGYFGIEERVIDAITAWISAAKP